MDEQATSLKGKLLLAMPGMGDPRFHKTVIFMCSDNAEGSMGIILNQQLPGMVLGDLFTDQLFPGVMEFYPGDNFPVYHIGSRLNSLHVELQTSLSCTSYFYRR